MDELYNSAICFNNLIKERYIIYAGSKGKHIKLCLSFKIEQFHHIAGLQKLSDIDMFNASKSKKMIFEDICNKKICLLDIEKSCFYDDINGRIRCISKIENILDSNEFILNFNKKIAKSKIDADYIITAKKDNENIHIFLKHKGNDEYCISSFFPCSLKNETYTFGQKKYTVIKKIKSVGEKDIIIIDKMK